MFRIRFSTHWLVIPALLLSLLGDYRAAFAQGGTVVASGLWAPRGVAVGDDGSVYVADTGKGGNEQFDAEGLPFNRGYSGKIVRVAPNGVQSVVGPNLPSQYAGVGYVTGPEGLVWSDGALWTTTSTILDDHAYPGEGALLRIDPSTGVSTTIANLGAYEIQYNPNGYVLDSDPYGLARGADGAFYVADAAANDILKVDPNNGQISTVAVIPGIAVAKELLGAEGNPVRGGASELDPVPTGLDFGSDGALYVSLLSGYPFPDGLASVARVGSGGAVSTAAGDFTMLTDIKHGADGAWYVVSLGEADPTITTGFGVKPGTGQVIRITASGQRQVVAGGLTLPNMLAFDKQGNMYVSVNSYVTDLDNPRGEVLRFNNVIGGSNPGMPRTGSPAHAADLLYAGLLLLALGLLLRLRLARVQA